MGSGALRQGEHHIHRLLGFTNSSNNPSRASAEKRCELMQTFHEREAVIGEDSVLGMKNELITHHVLLPKYCILTLPTAMWKNHFFVRQLLGNIGVLLIYGDFGYVSPNDATYPVLITCCLNFQASQMQHSHEWFVLHPAQQMGPMSLEQSRRWKGNDLSWVQVHSWRAKTLPMLGTSLKPLSSNIPMCCISLPLPRTWDRQHLGTERVRSASQGEG